MKVQLDIEIVDADPDTIDKLSGYALTRISTLVNAGFTSGKFVEEEKDVIWDIHTVGSIWKRFPYIPITPKLYIEIPEKGVQKIHAKVNAAWLEIGEVDWVKKTFKIDKGMESSHNIKAYVKEFRKYGRDLSLREIT